MRNVNVEVGARGIRPVDGGTESTQIVDSPLTSSLMESALNGEGELFWFKNPSEWIVVKNSNAVKNADGDVVREAVRVEIRAENNLYLLRNDDEFKDAKLKKLKSLPGYGLSIRPYAEMARENRAKAQAEAIRTLSTLGDADTIRDVIAKLTPKLESSEVIDNAVSAVLTSTGK